MKTQKAVIAVFGFAAAMSLAVPAGAQDKQGFYVGIGAYPVTDSFSVYGKLGGSTIGTTDVDVFSIGAIWRF